LRNRTLCLLALTALASFAAPQAARAKAGSEQPAIFAWSMPSHFGAVRDGEGRLIETQPYEVRPGPWTVDFTVLGPACVDGARYRWSVEGKRIEPRRTGRCRFSYRFPREGARDVRLDATVTGSTLSQTRRVVVQDWLIVSIGDSVGAGEGVPDRPNFLGQAVWQSARCHRSARAGTALAAKKIEDDDPHSSVTFVHLACSGADMREGLLGPYRGAVPPPDEPPLPPQVSELDQIAHRRQVDAVLLSVGANDIHFSDFVFFCAKHPFGDCFAKPYTGPGGDGARSAAQVAAKFVEELPARYDALAKAISSRIEPGRVHIVEYFDPTRDARGEPCRHILDIGRANVERAESLLLAPLNAALAAAAARNRWDEVGGVANLFREHGYCAGDRAWVSTLSKSLLALGGAGRHRGTLHPNEAGHEATSTLISKALEKSLYPGRTFPAAALPPPAEGGGEESGGIGAATIVLAALLLPLLLGAATTTLAAGALMSAAIAALLWLGRDDGSLLLLGFAIAALFLFGPPRLRLAATPLRRLAKTFRPLLLPLLVVLAAGTVKWSLAVQLVAAIGLSVLAWRAIVVPEANRSGIDLSWERELVRKAALQGAIAVGLGVAAVFVVRKAGIDNPYFEAIGNLASGLLLLAVVLWAAALLLRLFSYATTPVRAVLAFDLGLTLIVLALAAGLLPGSSALRDAWPTLFAILGGCALALLAIDAVLCVVAGEGGVPQPGGPRPITSHAAGLGFGAASVAAIVLAVSTAYGLVDAAENGQPLNPPEEESVEARVAPPGATEGDREMALAKVYAPVLVFTEGERWAPIPVGPYVANATLSGPPGTPAKVRSVRELPSSCPEFGQSSCYTLSIGCDSGELHCSKWSLREPGRLYRSGAVYVRTIEKGALPPDEPAGEFADRGPYRKRLATLVQYWYFYYYDEWKAPVFAGLLTQRHEGDWEAVTIGFDRRRRPLFVADSAHCAGSWRPWKDIEASTLLPGPRVHPLIAVAEGSHANYPDPDQKRSPDWASCAGAPAGVTTAISFASNIRDKTEYGWLWYPPPGGWLPANSHTQPMDFPGTWGADDRTTLRNFKSNPLGDPRPGPKTPTLQPLWREPVKTIFCGKYEPRECTPE
jgi:lysophospholipase L1-like esterase